MIFYAVDIVNDAGGSLKPTVSSLYESPIFRLPFALQMVVDVTLKIGVAGSNPAYFKHLLTLICLLTLKTFAFQNVVHEHSLHYYM